MRALFEDIAAVAANPNARLLEVNLPQNGNRRDCWFRFYYIDAGTTGVKVYKTRAAAWVGGTDFIASATTMAVDGVTRTITLNPNGTTPNMTGLSVRCVFPTPMVNGAPAVWAYTASPDLVVADNIKTKLATYAGVGQALGDFANTAAQLSVGDPGRTPVLPHIAIVPQAPAISGGRPMVNADFEIIVQVAVNYLKSKEDSFRVCKEYLGTVHSILGDEQSYLYSEAGAPLIPGDVGTPAPTENELYMVGQFSITAPFVLWRDDRNPR